MRSPLIGIALGILGAAAAFGALALGFMLNIAVRYDVSAIPSGTPMATGDYCIVRVHRPEKADD